MNRTKTNLSVQALARAFVARHGYAATTTTKRQIGRYVQLLRDRQDTTPRIAQLLEWSLLRRFRLTLAPRPRLTHGTRECVVCHEPFEAVTLRQLTCSKPCGREWMNLRRGRLRGSAASAARYEPRTREGGPRPLHGPRAHPFLVAFRAVRALLDAAPEADRPRVQARELARLEREHAPDGRRFAGVIAFALRENERTLCQCGCGAFAKPGNRYVRGHGSRAPGWAHQAGAARAARA